MTVIPPLKSQGIKTKLVNWISECADGIHFNRWVEPFMGTGVVAFNIRPEKALLCDRNPHIIALYKAIQSHEITRENVRRFLIKEGQILSKTEGEHYYTVRDRFNSKGDPLDFLFLSRACFNGMIRFNRSGGFNVPFCRKPNRFSKALVTKISNQVKAVTDIIDAGNYEFKHQDFEITISETDSSDLVYCDPPYIGRHVDYFDSWSDTQERKLHAILTQSSVPFIVSTWAKNRYRANGYIFSLWKECSILLREHFYHVGAREHNRNTVIEALLINFDATDSYSIDKNSLLALEDAKIRSGLNATSQLEAQSNMSQQQLPISDLSYS